MNIMNEVQGPIREGKPAEPNHVLDLFEPAAVILRDDLFAQALGKLLQQLLHLDLLTCWALFQIYLLQFFGLRGFLLNLQLI